jgi:acyl-[acyl-carrier-protein] desaturase
MQNVLTGYDHDVDVLQGLAYTSFQELATRVSHQNTGRYSDDPVADRIMTRVALDENLHMVFYRDALAALMEVDASRVITAIMHEVLTFAMPGSAITGFTRKAAKMADAGIYDLRIHHDDILMPLLRYWKVFERTGLTPEAEHDRERLARFLEKLDASARRFEERRATRREREGSAAS